jgi:hypothetical protein
MVIVRVRIRIRNVSSSFVTFLRGLAFYLTFMYQFNKLEEACITC